MSRSLRFGVVFAAVLTAVIYTGRASEDDHADRINLADGPVEQSPDWAEPKDAPSHYFGPVVQNAFGNTATSAQQQRGALSGKIVYMNSGHGWTWDDGFSPPWRLQRGNLLEMNEDYGNYDQLNFFAAYCFNAGATVVSLRPLGRQTNEIILDNTSAGVTFAGTWSDTSSTIYWGAAGAGAQAFRTAAFAATETATATYTPNIPVTGYYPVYCWVRHGSDRGDQLYRIRHTGGETLIRIPHHMVGNGWVYMGEYYFNAGLNSSVGSVVVSNLRGTPAGSVVVADAIRFGNGMGSVDQGGGVSGYPREDENMRYWVRANLGQGQHTGLYNGSGDDESDSWSAPGKMSAEMNREGGGTTNDRVHIAFHSNAGGGRGAVGLITGTPTANQALLAQLCGQEVNVNLRALNAQWEFPWSTRTTYTFTGGYGEITRTYFTNEMDATIIEVAYHDHTNDAPLMRDPKVRSAIGRSSLHAAIKFLNQVSPSNKPPLAYLPEPPTNVRATAANTNGNIAMAWTAPVNIIGSQSPTNYIIYRSTNGYGFGNPISVGNVTSFTVTNLVPNTDYYFRITGVNAGGESMPSEVVGCRVSSTNGPKVLVVNGFDRFDRTTNLRHNTARGVWDPPGNSGAIERVFPRWNNGFDYIVQHGKAIANYGMAFDSCQNEAVANNQVALANYPIVVWACGNETTNSETFSSTEQSRIATFLASGGNLFVSGADVAFDLDRATGPTAADRTFLHVQLHAAFTNDNSTSYTSTSVGGGIFTGRPNGTIDNGNFGTYWVQTPDVLAPLGGGATAALNYSGGTGGAAAILYDGSGGGGRTVLFGFPFETIRDATRRNQYMSDILTFLSLPGGTNLGPVIFSQPQSQYAIVGSNVTLTVVASGTPTLNYQWRFNGQNIAGATQSSYTRANVQFIHSGNYSVEISNAFDDVISANALLQVMLPPLQTLFSDNFDANTAANWVTNRSSSDCRIAFNYDYAPYGIPSAPNSTNNTTRGMKFEANVSLTNAAAINISPIGQSFSGDYRLRFDLWINANGPFPAGGAGSTQHGTAGIGTAGNRVQWTGAGANADGYWFAVDGEGQATDAAPDFRAYNATTLAAADSTIYTGGTAANVRRCNHPYYASTFPGGQTAPGVQGQTGALAVGTIGFAWRDVIISKTGNTVEWFINGLKIAAYNGASVSPANIFIGYWDSFNSLSSNTNLSFGMFDNVRVERFVTNVPPYLTSQPQSTSVAQGSNAVFNVTAGGTATLGYQWRFNGTNIGGATQSSYSRNNSQTNDAGSYSVVVTNASGSVTSSVASLTVLLPPSIVSQPEGLTVKEGTNVTFTVTATGSATLEYQWKFNGGDIIGATENNYTISNVTVFDGGDYSVVVANAAGELTSSNALLTVIPLVPFQFSDASVIDGNQLKLTLTGEPGSSVTVWRSEDLTNWTSITNVVLSSGPFEFFEPIDPAVTNRFYRAELVP